MGPTIIFDKSFLESLNPDEAVWLDTFFICNITPLFWIETLADLEKQVKSGRTPESVVGSIAYKTPDVHSALNVHHRTLLLGELLHEPLPDLNLGRALVSHGRSVTLGGESGVIIEDVPEERAFRRWQQGEFLEIEREQAREWRAQLHTGHLEDMHEKFRRFFPRGKPRTLEELKDLVDSFLRNCAHGSVMRLGLSLMGFAADAQDAVVSRWENTGQPGFREFAPYFCHVLSVDLFFALGLGSDLIGRGRASHRADVAYLYYLPFCNVFSSNDNLHAKLAPLFLRQNQVFVPGPVLKRDLARIDRHFSNYPYEIKCTGISSFAEYPPTDDRYLVSELWDRYMRPNWRTTLMTGLPDPNSPRSKDMVEKLNRLVRDAETLPAGAELDSDVADFMIVQREVMNKKGKWLRFPKGIERVRPEDIADASRSRVPHPPGTC